MNTLIPAGAVALDADELDAISGGAIWDPFVKAAVLGFKAGQWVWCAVECLVRDEE